jgi:TetR/AcrR family transcriptional regulator, tetracycline repressor protein
MPRPTTPLLSREGIVTAALRIIERDGFEAFSLPRLGEELHVRTPSLYYHYRDRAELLAEVARAMVRATRLPTLDPALGWEEWFVQLAVNFRQAVLQQRRAAPVLLRFLPRDVMVALYEDAAVLLDRGEQVPPERRVLLLDGLEKLTLGTIMIDSLRPEDQTEVFATVDPEEHPRLADAVRANPFAEDELFEQAARAFVRGVGTV